MRHLNDRDVGQCLIMDIGRDKLSQGMILDVPNGMQHFHFVVLRRTPEMNQHGTYSTTDTPTIGVVRACACRMRGFKHRYTMLLHVCWQSVCRLTGLPGFRHIFHNNPWRGKLFFNPLWASTTGHIPPCRRDKVMNILGVRVPFCKRLSNVSDGVIDVNFH